MIRYMFLWFFIGFVSSLNSARSDIPTNINRLDLTSSSVVNLKWIKESETHEIPVGYQIVSVSTSDPVILAQKNEIWGETEVHIKFLLKDEWRSNLRAIYYDPIERTQTSWDSRSVRVPVILEYREGRMIRISTQDLDDMIRASTGDLLFDLKNYQSLSVRCGLRGTLQERANDCDRIHIDEWSGVAWALVANTGHGNEIWQDLSTGTIWSAPLGKMLYGRFYFYTAYENCESYSQFQKEKGYFYPIETLESSPLMTKGPFLWFLPTVEDFEIALKNGLSRLVDLGGNWWWARGLGNSRALFSVSGRLSSFHLVKPAKYNTICVLK